VKVSAVLLIVLPGKLLSVAAAFRTKVLAEKIRLPVSFSFSFITYLQSSKQMGEYSSLLSNRCLTTASVGPAKIHTDQVTNQKSYFLVQTTV
uniref:Uncharacterized protein n=1 Tax=Catharus ustulatus TaxID=91951 RepID=A0A8C3U7T7_CATUS